MAIVVFDGKSYECAKAVKGVDYVKLYDDYNNIIVAFAGVQDFSAFTLQEGEWEKGISTDTVSANAKMNQGYIELKLVKPVSVETGLLITFQSPCDYESGLCITIAQNDYRLVDASGNNPGTDYKVFASGAMVSVILNTDAYVAYIQNAAVSSHSHSKGEITDFPSSMPASDVYSWAKQPNKPKYTASEVGLGNVNNTSDENKPVSTKQQEAINDAKKAGTDAQSNLATHEANTTKHITSTERNTWNSGSWQLIKEIDLNLANNGDQSVSISVPDLIGYSFNELKAVFEANVNVTIVKQNSNYTPSIDLYCGDDSRTSCAILLSDYSKDDEIGTTYNHTGIKVEQRYEKVEYYHNYSTSASCKLVKYFICKGYSQKSVSGNPDYAFDEFRIILKSPNNLANAIVTGTLKIYKKE